MTRFVFNSKIVGYEVANEVVNAAKSDDNVLKQSEQSANVQTMHELLQRPDCLQGTTYKIKTPLSKHSLYITINDVVLNADTPHEQRRPFEIFINSKNMEQFQWIIALTRIMSAVFRKGGECAFMVEELRCVFDPKGGYWKRGGQFMPSIVAEIGEVLERHLQAIGLLEAKDTVVAPAHDTASNRGLLCSECHAYQVVLLDGCRTCLSCGDSKCG